MFYRIWDLVYSKAFRAVAGLLAVAGVIAGIVALSWRFQPENAETVEETKQVETEFATVCATAIAEIEETAGSTPTIRLLDQAGQEAFFLAYATAARSCSYAEFIDVDRSTVTPFVDGVSMFAQMGSTQDGAADQDEPDAPTTGGGR